MNRLSLHLEEAKCETTLSSYSSTRRELSQVTVKLSPCTDEHDLEERSFFRPGRNNNNL